MLIREGHDEEGNREMSQNLFALNNHGTAHRPPRTRHHMISSSITNITSSARNTLNLSTTHQSPPHSAASTLNLSTAHQSPPHSAASTLDPSTAHQSSPHSAATPFNESSLNQHAPSTQEKTIKRNSLIYSRERPFNVIGPQRPRPIYT